MVEKQLHAHSMSRLVADDQGDQREHWYGSLHSDWAVHMGGEVRGDYNCCYPISAYHQSDS